MSTETTTGGTTPEHGRVIDDASTLDSARGAEPIAPDPVAYDSERNVAARRRGLSAPYIAGGRDPDQAAAEREDRRSLRILLVVVVMIVLSGFILGIVAALLGLNALVGVPS